MRRDSRGAESVVCREQLSTGIIGQVHDTCIDSNDKLSSDTMERALNPYYLTGRPWWSRV